MSYIYSALKSSGLEFMEYSFTAIDAYRNLKPSPIRFVLVEGSLVELAKAVDALEYRGLPYSDAAMPPAAADEFDYRFLCADSIKSRHIGASRYADFRRDTRTGVFFDPSGVYCDLRSSQIELPGDDDENSLFEAAVLASRFPLDRKTTERAYSIPENAAPLWQKDLLSLILTGPFPAQSFSLLDSSGFVAKFWPELAALKTVDHAKEYHPEGGGWSHTMETFSHRKTFDLALSLALLLHDSGKPRSSNSEGNKFDRHAELGADLSAKFLAGLGFSKKIVDDVYYLIRWHMMPAALPVLPTYKVRDIIEDLRFPQLLELYRCDEFSTFKGPDSYYAACAAYRAKVKELKNPYRRAYFN